MVEPEKPPKNSRKAQIQMDEELAIRLHEEEKMVKDMERSMMRVERSKSSQKQAKNSKKRLRSEHDEESVSSQKQAKNSKKRPRAEHDEESVKKQKLGDDAEKEELRACLDIVPGDDIAINVESLATKYLIVD
ncbi:hypothetical protein Tco_0472522 [Tanacetum coccineum]